MRPLPSSVALSLYMIGCSLHRMANMWDLNITIKNLMKVCDV